MYINVQTHMRVIVSFLLASFLVKNCDFLDEEWKVG